MAKYQIGIFALTKGEKPKIVLVESRTGARWIFPKGQPEKDSTRKKVALDEAWEEAGLKGSIKSRPHEFKVTYGETEKLFLYHMQVEKIHNSYPESKERKRKFVTFQEAEKLLQKDLRRALRSMAKRYM